MAKAGKLTEKFLDEMGTDVEATRTILQSLLVTMFSTDPNGLTHVSDLRRNVLATLSAASPDETNDQDLLQFRKASRQKVDAFFDGLNPIFPGLDLTRGPRI
jgi:hypothetical protein